MPPRAASRRAVHRMEKPLRVVDNLTRGVTADAEKAAAIRIVGVAADGGDPSILEVHQHSAERRMAVHRAHRADRAQGSHRTGE
jgi:hypothetical protein